MKWDDLTAKQRQDAVTAVARVENNGDCSCSSCMAVYESMAKAVVESLPSPATQTVHWEPRDGWPTPAQVQAWNGDGLSWRCAGGTVTMTSAGGWIRAVTSDGVIHSQVWALGLRELVPFRDGRPVSWAEVDMAVKATEVNDV
jgi:hypothetical protein